LDFFFFRFFDVLVLSELFDCVEHKATKEFNLLFLFGGSDVATVFDCCCKLIEATGCGVA